MNQTGVLIGIEVVPMASATPVTIASVVKTVGAWMSARKNDQPRLSPLIGGGGVGRTWIGPMYSATTIQTYTL